MNDVSNTVHRDHTRLNSEKASRNLFVESGVECDPTQMTSAALRIVPVAGPTGNISTVQQLQFMNELVDASTAI